jgi:hypothetical protein
MVTSKPSMNHQRNGFQQKQYHQQYSGELPIYDPEDEGDMFLRNIG